MCVCGRGGGGGEGDKEKDEEMKGIPESLIIYSKILTEAREVCLTLTITPQYASSNGKKDIHLNLYICETALVNVD